jgi:hypothetical protein
MRPPAPRDLRGRRQRSPNPQHCPRLLVVLPDQVLEFRGAKGIWRLGNLSTPKTVQKPQKVLHAKAKAEADYRFYARPYCLR